MRNLRRALEAFEQRFSILVTSLVNPNLLNLIFRKSQFGIVRSCACTLMGELNLPGQGSLPSMTGSFPDLPWL
jgi:hypothetical protein